MALLDFLKRKKEIEKAKVKSPAHAGEEKKAQNSEKKADTDALKRDWQMIGEDIRHSISQYEHGRRVAKTA